MKNDESLLTGSGPGQAMPEFTIVVLAIILIMLGIFEFGRLLYAYSAVSNAAQQGARYGILNKTDVTGMQNQAATSAIGLGLTSSNVAVSWPDGNSDRGNRLRVVVTYLFQTDTPLITQSLTISSTSTMTIQ